MDYQNLLFDASFIKSCLEFDRSIAEKAAKEGCQDCGEKLHVANFRRSGHGLPEGCPEDYYVRFSFCCSKDGCRKRMTPNSLRFMSRRVYASVAFVLLCVLKHGLSKSRFRKLKASLGVCRQTIARWMKWWRKGFPLTSFWREWSGRLPQVDQKKFPLSLLDEFTSDENDFASMLKFLRFISRASIR